MTRLLPVILFCGIFGVCHIADAETLYKSGNSFLRQCAVIEKNDNEATVLDTMNIMACTAYVTGMVNGVEAEEVFVNTSLHTNVSTPYCLPADRIESAQAVRIVLKYIRDNPSDAHKPAGRLVIDALHEAFPCSSSRK